MQTKKYTAAEQAENISIPGGAHPAASPWTMMSPTGSAPTETASPKRNRR